MRQQWGRQDWECQRQANGQGKALVALPQQSNHTKHHSRNDGQYERRDKLRHQVTPSRLILSITKVTDRQCQWLRSGISRRSRDDGDKGRQDWCLPNCVLEDAHERRWGESQDQ